MKEDIDLLQTSGHAAARAGADRALRLQEVMTMCGLARATIYKHIRAGDFPAPFKVFGRSSRWSHLEIQAWINTRMAGSRVTGVSPVVVDGSRCS